jgi:hypothetical protein
MLRHMRTTIRLDDNLLARVKREASQRGETFTSMVEKGLRLVLAQPARPIQRTAVRLPVCRAGGGTLPGVDISNTADLIDQMEGRS